MKSCNIAPCVINGLNVYPFANSNDLLQNIEIKGGILVAVNAEKILHATNQTLDIINRNIGYPDGIGAVWALKNRGYKDAVKLPGCELWLEIIKNKYRDSTFYLVGGKLSVIEATVIKLKTEFPGINIVHYRDGYIKSEEEKQTLIDDIQAKKPNVVFVAMGSPKQELLMEDMLKVHPAIYQGLGGSFDVYTGYVKRAPKWWVDNNLEWAYRLLKEPTRIKRQIHLVRFLFMLISNRL